MKRKDIEEIKKLKGSKITRIGVSKRGRKNDILSIAIELDDKTTLQIQPYSEIVLSYGGHLIVQKELMAKKVPKTIDEMNKEFKKRGEIKKVC